MPGRGWTNLGSANACSTTGRQATAGPTMRGPYQGKTSQTGIETADLRAQARLIEGMRSPLARLGKRGLAGMKPPSSCNTLTVVVIPTQEEQAGMKLRSFADSKPVIPAAASERAAGRMEEVIHMDTATTGSNVSTGGMLPCDRPPLTAPVFAPVGERHGEVNAHNFLRNASGIARNDMCRGGRHDMGNATLSLAVFRHSCWIDKKGTARQGDLDLNKSLLRRDDGKELQARKSTPKMCACAPLRRTVKNIHCQYRYLHSANRAGTLRLGDGRSP